MGKIKKLLMSALACVGVLGCAAVVGSKVEAAESEEFTADSLTAGASIASGDKVYDGTLFDLVTTESSSIITCIGGSAEKGVASTVVTETATSSDGKSYTKAVLSTSTTKDGKGFTITAGSKNINYAIYYTVSDSQFTYSTKSGYSKAGDIRVGGTTISVSGNKARNKAYIAKNLTLTAGSSVLIDTTANRVVIFGIVATESEEEIVEHTVTYYEGENVLGTEKIIDGATSTKSFSKYGYDFAGWYTSPTLEEKANLKITSDTNLYAKFTPWAEGTVGRNEITNDAIVKIASVITGSLKEDLELNPSIYTYMTGGSTSLSNVKLPGTSSSKQYTCLNTGGVLTTTAYGLKVVAPSNGQLTVCIGVGGISSNGDSRSAIVTDGANELEVTNDASNVFETSVEYAPRELTYNLEAGKTYYIGGTNGMRIYYVSFEETVKLNYQFDNEVEKNAVRFMGTINAEDLAKVSDIKLDLTLSDGVNSETVTVAFDTVYTSITDLEGFGEAEGVYYIVLELTELSYFREFTLNATLKVTIDGVEETATLAEVISLAVAE